MPWALIHGNSGFIPMKRHWVEGCHDLVCILKEFLTGTPLVVQRLRLRTPSEEEAWIQSLVRDLDPIHLK